MLHRDEVVWLCVNHTRLGRSNDDRWELVGIAGSYAEVDKMYCSLTANMACHSCYLLCWNWRHGWHVVQCHGGEILARTMEDMCQDGSCQELDDLLWSELVGWQHRHETVATA